MLILGLKGLNDVMHLFLHVQKHCQVQCIECLRKRVILEFLNWIIVFVA